MSRDVPTKFEVILDSDEEDMIEKRFNQSAEIQRVAGQLLRGSFDQIKGSQKS